MAIMKWTRPTWDPFRAMEELQEEMNRLFSSSLARFPETGTRRVADTFWTPPMDIYETKDELVVQCEVPGLKQEDINVTVHDDTLVVEGERKQSSEVKEENYYRMERWTGKFYRAIDLPHTVDSEKIRATYESGVLKVVLPKKPEAKPKQIQVKVN
ncbi:MAG: Hsp20/alpha crystallin family protein [Verrucomicrobiae bacterium]|nr:Hsp20/alpha crystallin family protein [Verrucomicrobiae bacterium]